MKQSQPGQSRLAPRSFSGLVSEVSVPASEGHSQPTVPQLGANTNQPLVFQLTESATVTIPMSYEPRYAYPLIVWLTSGSCPSDVAVKNLQQLSPQNYIGLAVDNSVLGKPAAASPLDAGVRFLQELVAIESHLVTLVQELRSMVNVHTERIFIAGAGSAASTAMLLMMHQPEWFGGCIAFGGRFPSGANLLSSGDRLTGRRFWLTSTSPSECIADSNLRSTIRTLQQRDADVTALLTDEPGSCSRSALRALDEWIVAGILAGHAAS